jgi:hypothetical protein
MSGDEVGPSTQEIATKKAQERELKVAQDRAAAQGGKLFDKARTCDNPIRDNSVLLPKPLHLVIKRK